MSNLQKQLSKLGKALLTGVLWIVFLRWLRPIAMALAVVTARKGVIRVFRITGEMTLILVAGVLAAILAVLSTTRIGFWITAALCLISTWLLTEELAFKFRRRLEAI